MLLKKESGFTLIEVLVALTIVSIISLAFFTIINMTTRKNAKNEKDIQAMDIAQSQIEYLIKDIKNNAYANEDDIKINFDENGKLVIVKSDNQINNLSKGLETSSSFEVKYKGNEKTYYVVDVKLNRENMNNKNNEKPPIYLYNIKVNVTPKTDLTNRNIKVETKVLAEMIK